MDPRLKRSGFALALGAVGCLTVAHAQQTPENAVAPVIVAPPPPAAPSNTEAAAPATGDYQPWIPD